MASSIEEQALEKHIFMIFFYMYYKDRIFIDELMNCFFVGRSKSPTLLLLNSPSGNNWIWTEEKHVWLWVARKYKLIHQHLTP